MFRVSEEVFKNNLHMVGDDRDDLDRTFPFIIKKGKGAKLWDLDGNEYIDFTCACGSIVLGYCYEEVDKAVIEHITNIGNIFPTQLHEAKIQLTKMLMEIYPRYERAVYFKTGSDATDAAIRIARMATGKDKILTCGYHGWHDWQLNNFPRFRFDDQRHINFRYDLELLEEEIEKNRNEIAAVIVTPDMNYFDAEYFRKLEEIIKKNNLLFILDEVASGFRFKLGGLQKLMNLSPDMTCLGKGLANGYSISAVLASNKIMKDACLKTHMWSTYNGEMTGYAAAIKTLDIMKRENVRDKVEILACKFADGIENLFEKYGIDAEILSNPNIFQIGFEDYDLHCEFTNECYRQGVILSKDFESMINYSHTNELIDEALQKIENAIMVLIENGKLKKKYSRTKLSRDKIHERMIEEFDADTKYSIFRNRE